MVMTLGDIKTRALQLVDEYSQNGNIIPSTDGNKLDYTLRMNSLCDMAQKEIAQTKKLESVYSFTQYPIDSQLGNGYGFRTFEKHPNSEFIAMGKGIKSCYFEVDNIATIHIEEFVNNEWVLLELISNTVKNKYTAYKKLINSQNENDVRLRFSGVYPYQIRYVGLFEYNFPTADDIPDYRPFLKYSMPDDYMQLKEIILESDPSRYNKFQNYYWENVKTFVVPYEYKGSFEIQYYKYPKTIDDTTPDTYQLELDTEALQLIPYYVAAHVIIVENAPIGTLLLNMYQQKLASLQPSGYLGQSSITDVKGW